MITVCVTFTLGDTIGLRTFLARQEVVANNGWDYMAHIIGSLIRQVLAGGGDLDQTEWFVCEGEVVG